ncbi:MAG TPA: hypothetical protein VML75_20375, partial [Kofleriaceae bacterium]|nr:hypothetical protein [Kofleriaceae bacterium]
MWRATMALVLLVLLPGSARAEKPTVAAAELLGRAHRAFEQGDYADALVLARSVDRKALVNDDYALYIEAQSAYLTGETQAALTAFRAL